MFYGSQVTQKTAKKGKNHLGHQKNKLMLAIKYYLKIGFKENSDTTRSWEVPKTLLILRPVVVVVVVWYS